MNGRHLKKPVPVRESKKMNAIAAQLQKHLNYHKKFTPEEFESQYNLRLGRPDYEQTVIPQWLQRSEAAREKLQCTLDIRYGDGEKQMLDVFSCGNSEAPCLLYFHGGYWQRGDKSIYSFLAEPYVANGVNVIVVGYDLCPAVTLTQISEQARQAVAWVYNNADEFAINANNIIVMGHSAGGHITEMMMATSPMINHHPNTSAPQLVVVGGAETDEFHRQSQMYVDAFTTDQRQMEMYVVPGVDHFDELNILADADSEFFRKTLALMG